MKHGEEQQSTNRSNKVGRMMKHGKVAKHRVEQQSTRRSSEVVELFCEAPTKEGAEEASHREAAPPKA